MLLVQKKMVAKVVSGKSKYKSPKKEEDKKKQHVVVSLLHPDGKKTLMDGHLSIFMTPKNTSKT
jgi:hypothetical protein